MKHSFNRMPLAKIGLIATTAVFLGACSDTNKSPSVGPSEEKARTFAKTSGDVGAALTKGETLTARMVGVTAQELNYGKGTTGKAKKVTISIKKDADGNIVLTINGKEHTFTDAQKVDKYGYEFKDKATKKYISLWSQTGEIDDLLKTGEGYAQVVMVQSTGVGSLEGDYKAFAVIGTETEDAAVKDMSGKATYSGRSRIDAVPSTGFKSNSDSRVTIKGDLSMEADFDAGNISGSVSDLEIRDAGEKDYVAAKGEVNLETASFDSNGFEGDLSIDDDFAKENEMKLSDGGYSGAFYGLMRMRLPGRCISPATLMAKSTMAQGISRATRKSNPRNALKPREVWAVWPPRISIGPQTDSIHDLGPFLPLKNAVLPIVFLSFPDKAAAFTTHVT